MSHIRTYPPLITILKAIVLTTVIVVFTYMALNFLFPGRSVWPYLILEWAIIFVPVQWVYYRNAKADAESSARFPLQLVDIVLRFGSDPDIEIEGFAHRVSFLTGNGSAQIERIEAIGHKGSTTTQVKVYFEALSDERLWIEKREFVANAFYAIKGRPADLVPISNAKLNEKFLLFGNADAVDGGYLSDPKVIGEISRLSEVEGLDALRMYFDGDALIVSGTFTSRSRPGVVNPLSLRYFESMLSSGFALVSILGSRRHQ